MKKSKKTIFGTQSWKFFAIAALAVIGCFMAGCGDAEGGSTGHTHDYSTEWSKDATQHWHECTAGDGAKADAANHSPGDWIIDTPATETADGSRHKECTVCAYVTETEVIPATGSSGDYLITGKFSSHTGTGDAVFYADYVSNARSVSRAVGGMGATEKELSGKIEDGDIVFNLKGVYDTETEKFLLSAGSSVLVFQLVGTLSSTGDMSDANAVVKVKDGTEWITHEVAVTATEEAKISGNASATQQEGLPSAWFGEWDPVMQMANKVLTAYQVYNPMFPENAEQIVDIVVFEAGQKYEIVMESDRGYSGPNTTQGSYLKVVVEADGADLKWTSYFASAAEKFADAKAFDITTATDETLIMSEAWKRP